MSFTKTVPSRKYAAARACAGLGPAIRAPACSGVSAQRLAGPFATQSRTASR